MTRRRYGLAMDRSTRSYDQDGHLRVLDNVLSAAGPSPYLGSEIPDGDKLGLSPGRVYQLLRPADELKRAAASLAGKPILIRHIAVSSKDHPHDDVCGAVGSDVAFDGTSLRGSLTFWTDEAIRAIETETMRDLSAGYWFKARMQPGSYQGIPIDGVMTNLAFNHLSLVVDGRVQTAMVGDSAAKVKRAMSAMSATNDDNDDDVPVVTAQDPHSALLIWLQDRIQSDDMSTANQLIADMLSWATGDNNWATDANPFRNRGRTKMNTTAVIRQIQEIDQARLAVRPYVGDVTMACDSADQVYIQALSLLGHRTADLQQHPGAATAVWPALKGKPPVSRGRLAADSDADRRRLDMFPNMNRLRRI